MIVMKFGGTSVGTPEAMLQAAGIVERSRPRRPAVVVSALSKVTDALIAAARSAEKREKSAEDLVAPLSERHRSVITALKLGRRLVDADLERLEEALQGIYLLRELTPRSLDYVVAFGEIMSSKIFAALLVKRGLPARAWTGWEAGIVTDGNHGSAAVLEETYPALRRKLAPELGKRVPVVTGFLGGTRDGKRTTLGRGGSDYSAALVGRALDAEEIQIWTDVNGILSCDPRVVKDAFTLRYLTFAEAAELAYFGAKVLHPKTVEPAVEVGIPVRIANTFQPDDPGTLVVKESAEDSERVVEGLSVKRANLLVHLESTRMLDAEGYLALVFGTLARHGVSVDCLATSEVSVSLTVDAAYEARLSAALEELDKAARATVQPGRSIVCAVGEGMQARPGVAGEIFGVFAREGINVELISQGASALNLTCVVADGDADRALVALHAHFLRGRQRTSIPDPPHRGGRRRAKAKRRPRWRR